MNARRRVLTVAGWISMGVLAVNCEASEGPELLHTPAWSQPGGLWLRETQDGQALLLRNAQGIVYRYEPAGAPLTQVPAAQWDAAGGAIADCERQPPAVEISIDAHSGRARIGERPLVLDQPQVMTTVKSPSGRQALVVSSSGERGSVAPFLGQGRQAPFFHQVASLPDGATSGPAQRLPFGGRTGGLTACWSADERFAVYTDLVMSSLAIVPVPRAGAAR